MPDPDARFLRRALELLEQGASQGSEQGPTATPEDLQELGAAEAVLSGLAETLEPLPPRQELRGQLLASLDPETRFEGFVERLSVLFDLAAPRVRELLGARRDPYAEEWASGLVPGNRLLHFDGGPRVAAADCGLVYLEPGLEFPNHRHLGTEWALSLEGRAQESGGSIWEPGDLVQRPAGSAHSFRAMGDGPYLFAVVLFGGIDLVEP